MPTYPPQVSKLVLSGTLPRNDTWSIGVWLHDGGQDLAGAFDPNNTLLEDIRDLAIIWFTSGQARISSVAKLTSVKLNQIGTDGKYLNPYTQEALVSDGNGVPGGIPSPQWQHMSLAITHRTSVTRGPANSGRVFPPAVLASPGAGGVVADADLVPMANVWRNFLQGVYDATPGEALGMPLVVSTGTKAAPNVGTRRNITRVEVGNVVDVQNRRRNALPEKYVDAEQPLNTFAVGAPAPGTGQP